MKMAVFWVAATCNLVHHQGDRPDDGGSQYRVVPTSLATFDYLLIKEFNQKPNHEELHLKLKYPKHGSITIRSEVSRRQV
jgi:hypothetical protein